MMEEKRKVYWMGPVPLECQISGRVLGKRFVDGSTSRGWAIMHPMAHADHGRGLGTGRGQLYEKQADGRWLKIEG
jgi:hypothetical protein